MKPAKQQKIFSSFFDSLTPAGQLRIEKARLEAFLAAVPGEYCGFSIDGSVVYSKGFCDLLELDAIENMHDIQTQLTTSDSAALEGMAARLQDTGNPFSITVQKQGKDQFFRLSGSRGTALDGQDQFDILWIEDITEAHGKTKILEKQSQEAEKESERLQTILDTLPMPLWMRNAKAELIWCNKNYAAIFDETPAAIIAEQKEIPLSSKDKTVSLKDMAQSALNSGNCQHSENYIIVEGARRRVHLIEQPLPSSARTLGLAQDITREEELETELKRYAAANKELMEQLRTAIGIYNPDTSLEFYNAAFTELWSLEDQWLNNRPKLGDIMEKLRETRRLPEQADFRSYKESWLKMFTGLIDPHEEMLYLPDGTALRMLVVPHPMGGLMMTFEDVTSRLELESSYNTLIAVQKETLDNLAEGVAVYGGDGRLKLWNPSFASLWGLNPEDLDGEQHVGVIANKMSGFFEKENWDSIREKLIAHGVERKIQEGRFERTNSTLIEFTTVPLPDGGILVSYFDVTDSVKVENALREKNAALEAAEQLKLDFLANVSYQLRTPLSSIMGFADILDNQYFGELNERQAEYTKGIQNAGTQLVTLIDDILDLSTIEAGYMELSPESFEVKSMLEGLHDLTQDWARKEKLEVKLNCAETIGSMTADERRIKQALLNLVRNAINFTPEGGTITVSAQTKDKNIEFIVADTGIGIPADALERIFDPFERLQAKNQADNNGSSSNRGAGLGLSLVKNIIELHGGKISIQSEENTGTAITLSLPKK